MGTGRSAARATSQKSLATPTRPSPPFTNGVRRFDGRGGGEYRSQTAQGRAPGGGSGGVGEACGRAAHDQLVRQRARLVERDAGIPRLEFGEDRLCAPLALTQGELIDRREPEELEAVRAPLAEG